MKYNKSQKKKLRKMYAIVENIDDLLDPERLEDFSVKDLSNRSLFSVATIYNYFKGKKNIILFYGARILRELKEKLFNEVFSDNYSLEMKMRHFFLQLYQYFSKNYIGWIVHSTYSNQLFQFLVHKRNTPNFKISLPKNLSPQLEMIYYEFLSQWIALYQKWTSLVLNHHNEFFKTSPRLESHQLSLFLYLFFQGLNSQLNYQGWIDALDEQEQTQLLHSAMNIYLPVFLNPKVHISLNKDEFFGEKIEIEPSSFLKSKKQVYLNKNYSQQEINQIHKVLKSLQENYRKNRIHNIPIETISEKINISKTTIYKYFSGKEEIEVCLSILALAFLNNKIQSSMNVRDDPITNISKFSRFLYQFYVQYPIYHKNFAITRLYIPQLKSWESKFIIPERISWFFRQLDQFAHFYYLMVQKGIQDFKFPSKIQFEVVANLMQYVHSGFIDLMGIYEQLLSKFQISKAKLFQIFMNSLNHQLE